MNLDLLGWTEAFESYRSKDEDVARITAVHRSHLRGMTESGEINVHYSGDFSQDPASVGDWVVLTPLFVDEQKETAATIKKLIPRKSKISRIAAGEHVKEQVMAANIDIVFVVTSIHQDFNLNRLQRYLLLIKDGQAKPVVVLSKIDLEPSHQEIIKNLEEDLDDEIQIIPTSIVSNIGVGEIKDLIPKGRTSVFVGSSGVGKSSLVNLLLGEELQAVNEVKKDDGKGKHTTTSRQMFFLPDGGMIIDTPGIKGVSIHGSEENLSEAFNEIEELMTRCKFSNCSHTTDPGCAIVEALEDSNLEQSLWDNYIKLSKEIAHNNSKLKKQTSSNSKKKWKKVQTDYKNRKKFKAKS